jgi:hypothetical protein
VTFYGPPEERIGDYEKTRELRKLAHRAVTEGVNLKYLDLLRQAVYDAADRIDTLLTELAAREEGELQEAVEWWLNDGGGRVFAERESRYTVEDLLATYRERFRPATEPAQPEEERCGNTIHSNYVTDPQCLLERGHSGDCLFGLSGPAPSPRMPET